MATLDQLSPERRAILELVLGRGQSYDDIAGMLGMPAARVRDHAREALVSLAPRTADRVDPEWRGQVADYVLGQQSGPESTATRGHLKRSEPARAWALSMLDSLGDLYQDGNEPDIPEAESPAASRRRGRDGPAVEAAAAGAPAAAATRERERRGRRRETSEAPASQERAAPGRAEPLSPQAQAIVRQRRLIAAAVAAVAVVLLAVFVIGPWIFGGNDDDPAGTASDESTPAAEQPEILGQLELQPVEGEEGGGVALVTEQAGQQLLVIQARLEPSQANEAYEVWLYNSDSDAQSLGAQVTDEQGTYQAAGPLPPDFEQYEFIDISREPTNQDAEHSGESVLRARIAGGQPSAGAGGALPPGTETPPPTGAPPLPEGGSALPEGGLPAPGGGAPTPEGAPAPQPGGAP